MSGLEVAGLVLSVLPLVVSSTEAVENLKLLLRKPTRLYHEYGTFTGWILNSSFRDALDVMTRVEQYVFRVEDEQVVGFMNAYTSSFNMIGVAGAIIAQVAITAISLTSLTESHWTAEAFFIISLVTGALSVFFSCAISPAFHGLHSADDIKDFLSKPITAANETEFNELLSGIQRSGTGEQDLDRLKFLLSQDRWKVASCYSAIMLVAPMKLLNIALNFFLIGLGVYLGKVYTANLVPTFGSGSLGLLIIFVATTLLGIAIFYVAQGFKGVEAIRLERFKKIMLDHGEIRTAQFGSGNEQSAPHSTQNSIYESTQIQNSTGVFTTTGDGEGSGFPPVLAGGSVHANQVPVNNVIHSAITNLIKAQEDNLQASRRLLEALGNHHGQSVT